MTQQVIDQIAERARARREAYHAHVNKMLDAKLVDLGAISRAVKLPRAAAPAGEVVKATSMADFTDKYAHVAPGGTVDLGDTVLDFGSNQFALRAGATVKGGEMRFTRPIGPSGTYGGKQFYGAVIPNGVANTGFIGTRLRSNNGVMFGEGGHANLVLDGIDAQWGDNGNYYCRHVFFCGGGIRGLQWVNSLMHDSPNSDRTLEIWGASDFNYSDNQFVNVKDGGHIMENNGNVSMLRNRFRLLGRMGIEVQGESHSTNFLYQDNVVESFIRAYFDCELISMCAVNMTGVMIDRNYVTSAFPGAWGNTEDQGQRLGIAIEAMTADNGCTVQNNIVGGPNRFACIVAAGGLNMLCKGNQAYGAPTVWGDYVSEPGTRGMGTIKDGGGNVRHPEAIPAPPDGGGGNGGGPVITNVVATEANPPVVTWQGGAATVTRTDKDGKTDVKPDGSPAVFPNAVSPFTDTFIPKDHYDFTWHLKYVVGTPPNTATSNTIQLPKPTTPPPPTGVIVSTDVEIDGAGKVLSSKSTTKPRTVER